MDWQQLASLLIVAATALAFAWGKARSRNGGTACDHCPSFKRGTPQPIVFRGRRGERPQVIVKRASALL